MSASRTADQWIISARWDVFVCLSTVWFPLVTWLAWQLADGIDAPTGETIVAACVVGLSIPHFLTTFTFTYMDADQRRHYRRHRILYFGIPLTLIVGSWLYSATVGPVLMVTIWLLFGEHHVAAQNIGFLALYRQRGGEGEIDRRLDHLVFNLAWITTAASYGLRGVDEPSITYYSRPAYSLPYADRDGLVGALAVLAITSVLVWLGRQAWRWWTGEGVNLPKLLFMVTTWPSFFLVPFVVRDVSVALVLRIGYHSIQYLALVYLLNRRRVQARAAPRGDFLEWLVARGPATYFVLHVLAAAAVYALTDVYGWIAGPGNDLSLRFLFFPGVPLAHFFLDGLTWRFADAHVRETVSRFLGHRDPPRAQEPARAVA